MYINLQKLKNFFSRCHKLYIFLIYQYQYKQGHILFLYYLLNFYHNHCTTSYKKYHLHLKNLKKFKSFTSNIGQ